MRSQGHPIGAEALLTHQDFVLALARNLLSDEHAAQDVAQETWVAALTRPPHSIASLRAWLAQVTRTRAAERLRRDARRAEQERFASRSEVDESGERLRERLALQHQVVAAVLDLREPYRTMILMHYYEGLTAAEIANRQRVPSGTVRARISRAHDALREKLDAEFGGARDGWTHALGALLCATRSTHLAAKAWITAAAISVAITVPIAIWIRLSGQNESSIAQTPIGRIVAPTNTGEPDIDPPELASARAPIAAASAKTAATETASEAASVELQKASKDKNVNGGLENGGFEGKVDKDGAIPGWKLIVGATNGANEPLSIGKLDTKEKHGGHASLFLSGDDTTRAWRSAQQTIDDVRPGGMYHLSGWTKTKDVHAETVKGTSIHQFQNCFVTLLFLDDNGESVGQEIFRPSIPTSGWHDFKLDLTAPETARSVLISASLTMSGSLWVDDVTVTVDGGHELPPKEILIDEGFEDASGLPAGFDESVGATNGDGSKSSTIAVDRGAGANGSHASLRFSGEKTTIRWMGIERKFDAVPGDAFTLSAMVRADNVRKEGIQFPNLHMRLVFFDADGKALGAAKYGQPGAGTYDWKELTASGVAPEGTVRVLVGFFLSMSGDAWFDDLRFEKRSGGTPAYADWLTLETKHLTLRYPKDNPRASQMKQYGEKLDRAFENVVAQLGVDYTERITMYIYRDGFRGKKLTGRDLDFANPEGRAVHQGPNSTLSHEMAHCIALKLGTSQTGILGEGIAVWLNGDTPEFQHDHAAKLLASDKLPSMKDLLEHFRDQEDGYPAAGSFCGYLIQTYGIEKFRQLYPASDPSAVAQSLLGKSFDAIDEDWRAFLSRRK